MKRTLMMTAAMIFTGQMAFAAIDAQQLADSYITEGYTFVEVKQGPTQTKIEAVKGASIVEAIYDNETGEIISQEIQAADAEEQARTGVEVKTTDKDFDDSANDNNDDQAGDEDDDHDASNDDGDDSDHNDGDDGADDEDGNDDNSGDDDGNGDDHGGGSGGNGSSDSDCE